MKSGRCARPRREVARRAVSAALSMALAFAGAPVLALGEQGSPAPGTQQDAGTQKGLQQLRESVDAARSRKAAAEGRVREAQAARDEAGGELEKARGAVKAVEDEADRLKEVWDAAVRESEVAAEAASTIKLAAQTRTYAGKALAYTGKVTRSGSTGKVTYKYYSDAKCTKEVKAANVKAAKTYYVMATLAADASHKAATSAAAKLTVAKAANPVTAKATAKSAAFSTLKTKAVAVAPLAVTKAQGKVTYARSSGSSALTVNKATGKVTVRKGTRKGTYTAKVKVTAAGNANYKSGSKTVTVKVTVK